MSERSSLFVSTTRFLVPWGVACATLALMVACSGSGSGSGGFDNEAQLLDIRFPDPADVNAEAENEPPSGAPLVQVIEFVFSGRPNPDRLSSDSIQLRDSQGGDVAGTLEVVGSVVRFTPDFPLEEARQAEDGSWSGGGAGLRPETTYSVRVGSQTWSFITSVAAGLSDRLGDPGDDAGVAFTFTTTRKVNDFFRGVDKRRPRVVSTTPEDGATSVTPMLYSDPDDRFAERAPFIVRFDAPLRPDDAHLAAFQVVDLDDRTAPSGLVLGTDVRLLENNMDGAVVEVQPSGILPLGHRLSLEIPERVYGLAEGPIEIDGQSVVATFTIADAAGLVRDDLVEAFDDESRRDDDAALLEDGELPAQWDLRESGVLEAAFAFPGNGILGRFVPFEPGEDEDNRTIILNTNSQVFPLLDGSTPDAPAGFNVVGGVFDFSEIHIPKGVVVEFRGSRAPIITATGSVTIEGKIRLNGQNGTPENAFDSGVTSIPGGNGGPGGGRGGEAHPIIYWPPDQFGLANLVSPATGGHGFGAGNRDRSGGQGGECGTLDNPNSGGQYSTNREIDCNELGQNNNGDQAAGGSGGSYLTNGRRGRVGIGNVLPDLQGGWIVRRQVDDPADWDRLDPGEPGTSPFQDLDAFNDYIGVGGELEEVLGGQGGGSGGSRSEAYYCGQWCLLDVDPVNDAVCKDEFQGRFADSVTDARGGSGGGGGGAITIKSLGPISIKSRGQITAKGGLGAGGETLGRSNWGGPSGAGSGGAIVLQSANSIDIKKNCELNVEGGAAGGAGIIQLQVPVGATANVSNEAEINPKASWVDKDNTLNPARFTPLSVAISDWYDMGRTIDRGDGDSHPGFFFEGIDANGLVLTDLTGNVQNPELADIACDYLGQLDPLRPGEYLEGQEPRADFIPPNASVQVSFQGARAVAEGSKEVDPNSITPWTSRIDRMMNRQFIRYRIRFNLAADGSTAGAESPRPAVQSIRIRSEF